MSNDVLIIGAGLSGLAAARHLQQHGVQALVLEARDRVGGRALSVPSGEGMIDLGPAWVWPAYQPAVMSLLAELHLSTLPQFEDGAFLYETATDVQKLQYPKRYADACRIQRGVQGLAQAMAATLPENSVRLSTEVVGLSFANRPTVTLADGSTETADRIVSSVPGPLLHSWVTEPGLPTELTQALTRWPTWMAAHAKVLVCYEQAFWREQGLSGSAVSQRGPLMEINDQSDPDANSHALFGFVGWPAHERVHKHDELLEASLLQLERLFGKPAAHPIAHYVHDWSEEPFTTTDADKNMPSGHPAYGEPELSRPWYNDQLFLAGAEAATPHGGLIEGAITAGERAARQVLALRES